MEMLSKIAWETRYFFFGLKQRNYRSSIIISRNNFPGNKADPCQLRTICHSWGTNEYSKSEDHINLVTSRHSKQLVSHTTIFRPKYDPDSTPWPYLFLALQNKVLMDQWLSIVHMTHRYLKRSCVQRAQAAKNGQETCLARFI